MTNKNPIKHEELGIDSNDIRDCTDINKLKHWLFVISEDVSRIATQIEDGKEYYREHNKYKNYQWFRAANIKQRLFNNLIYNIEQRIKTLCNIDSTFMEAARSILSKDQFALILKKCDFSE